MAICGVAAAHPVLTYTTVRSGPVLAAPCIWRIPEQAPTPEYSDRLGGRDYGRYEGHPRCRGASEPAVGPAVRRDGAGVRGAPPGDPTGRGRRGPRHRGQFGGRAEGGVGGAGPGRGRPRPPRIRGARRPADREFV